jgi:putative ABC transport system permease protein
VYGAAELAALALAGLAIALVGALLPAGWAAQSRTAAPLRTE